MKFTLVLLFSVKILTGESRMNERRMSIIREAYYSNLLEFTLDLSKKVFETKTKLEENIPAKLKLRYDKFYRQTRIAFHERGQNEKETLNQQFNQLKSFVHRVKLAKSAEQNIKGENLYLQLTSIQVKLENVKRMVHRFMRKLRIKIEHEIQLVPTKPQVKENKKLQSLTTLKDLQTSLAFMKYEFRKAKNQHARTLSQKVGSGN